MSETNFQVRRLAMQVTGYGAALSGLVIAPGIEAAVVELDPNPKVVPYGSAGYGDLGLGGTLPDLFHVNTASLGKAFFGSTNSSVFDIRGLRPASASSIITAGPDGFDNPAVVFPATASGTATLAFLTHDGDVGWIKLDLGGFGGPITYLAAAFEDAGNPIHIPQPAVPEPSTASLLAGIGLLAMGSTGVRRMRKRRQAANGETTH